MPIRNEGIELSIILPCLNEEKTVGICVRKAQQFLVTHKLNGEIIVADNGSTDQSAAIARDLGAKVIHVAEKGYGSAIMGGVYAALGTFSIVSDADDSYDLEHLFPFLEKLRCGIDVVIGNRFRGTIHPGAMPFLHRYFGNPLLSSIGRILFHSPVHDFHCGLRGFRTEAFRALPLKTTGMEFASEMIVKSLAFGLRMTEVPTDLFPDGRGSHSHLHTWRDGWRHLRFMLLHSPRWLFLYPGLLLIVCGIGFGFWLLPHQQYVFDIHTLLYCGISIVIGFQAIVFFLLAKAIAVSLGIIPSDKLIEWTRRSSLVEVGIITGILLIIGGLLGSIYAIFEWESRAFGHLNPSHTLRIVIPSVTCFLLGGQIVFSSFLFGILHISRKTDGSP